MTAKESLEERLRELGQAMATDESLVKNVMRRIENKPVVQKLRSQLLVRRLIMNRLTKIAATAAAIIVIAALAITFLGKSVPTAYAIEQTIEAHHTVRYLHIKDFDANHEDEPKHFWLEFDETGQVKNVRMDFPDWASGGDGHKIVVWKEGKARVWFKKKKFLLTVRDRTVAERMLLMIEECDPKKAIERLYKYQDRTGATIEINEPADKAKPVTVTATYPPKDSIPGRRQIFLVDQATKLVTAIESYRQKDGQYQYIGVMEFYDYNLPIEAKMFTFAEVNAEVTRIDQAAHEVGLAQGQLSDEEIAVEVVRQFFEALIAKDYVKAGKLLEGIPGNKMQEMFSNIKFLRIISIGSAAPHPNPRTKGLIVPSVIEIEKDGEISEWKFDQLGVRQVYNQPGCWTIFGGI